VLKDSSQSPSFEYRCIWDPPIQNIFLYVHPIYCCIVIVSTWENKLVSVKVEHVCVHIVHDVGRVNLRVKLRNAQQNRAIIEWIGEMAKCLTVEMWVVQLGIQRHSGTPQLSHLPQYIFILMWLHTVCQEIIINNFFFCIMCTVLLCFVPYFPIWWFFFELKLLFKNKSWKLMTHVWRMVSCVIFWGFWET